MESHGFLDVSLNGDLCNLCEVLPRARNIARIGIVQEIHGNVWQILERSLHQDDTYVGWCVGALYREGSYGKIYKAHRMVIKKREDGLYNIVEPPREVILKTVEPPSGSAVLPTQDITAHVSESLLHVLAWNTIQRTLTPWAIPQPYEVFGNHSDAAPGWKSMSLCMSYIHGRTLLSFFEKHWHRHRHAQNTATFLEILAQIAYVLYFLQRDMRLNHRDLKINNVLIRTRPESFALELDGLPVLTRYEVVLIDFGFACVGCPSPAEPITLFQSGSWFPSGELCCKQGRDLAQLIYSIHCYYPLDRYLTAPVFAAVREWMQIRWSDGVANALHGFSKEGRPRSESAASSVKYNTGIYEFLRRPEVDPNSCSPQQIYHAVYRLKTELTHET